MENNRRKFIRTISVFSLVSSVGYHRSWGMVAGSLGRAELSGPLKKLGTVKIKTPKDFSRSPFGIGCETLDRDLWKPKEIFPWMENLPVKWARLQTGWARVEKIKGQYDWAWLDESVDGLIQRGFKPFFNVGYGNPNYTEGDTGYYPMVSNEALAAWKRFIHMLTLRYKNRIQYFEIWNEPNLRSFWKPDSPNPAKYVGLVSLTVPIIRKNHPDAVIIGGVVSRLPFDYIRSLFDNGLAKEIDIFSFHPYGVRPEDYTEPIKKLRKLIDEYKPSIKIWQGENGYPSQPNSSGYAGEAPWTENIQAKFMLRRLLIDCSLGIDMTLWFLIVDIHDYPKGTGNVNYKGILRVKPSVQPKVAFKALQNLGTIINGEVNALSVVARCVESHERLSDGNDAASRVYSMLLDTGKRKVFAYWDTVKIADEYPLQSIDIALSDSSFEGFREPVLIDLLSGEVFDLKQNIANENQKQKILAFRKLPLTDYPMLIAEKSEIEFSR